MADVVFRYLIGNHLEAFWKARTAPLCQCFALISYCGALKKKVVCNLPYLSTCNFFINGFSTCWLKRNTSVPESSAVFSKMHS